MHQQPVPPEDDSLAAWLRAVGPEELPLPDNATAWYNLTTRAGHDGLAGLILEHAAALGLELPTSALERLRLAAACTAAQNLNAFHRLAPILHDLSRAGVPAMLLKGAALSLTLYRRPDLRPMSDVDLLIMPKDAADAVRILQNAGCRPGLALLRDDFFPRYHYEMEMILAGPRPVRIDLHVRPFRPLPLSRIIPDHALFDAAQTIGVEDAVAFVPRPELMFLHLAAHSAFHGCSRLLWLYDLKRLAGSGAGTMNWDLILQRVSEWRLAAAARCAVTRAEEKFGPICPAGVRGELARLPASWRDRLTLRQAPRDATSPGAHVLCNLICTPGVRFRLGYLAALLLPGRRHLAGVYKARHRGWVLCAHVWRAARAAGRLLTAPLRRVGLSPAR